MRPRLLVLWALSPAACVQSPTVPTPGRGADAGIAYADVVLAFTESGEPRTCGAVLACGTEPEACGPPEVLGPPDTMTFALEAGGSLDLGFRCAAVVERGGEGSDDVTVWASVPEGSSAVVEVSEDGTTYEPWTTLTLSNQGLDLATIERTYLRFIRIADSGAGGILIDAVEGI